MTKPAEANDANGHVSNRICSGLKDFDVGQVGIHSRKSKTKGVRIVSPAKCDV